MSRMSKNRDLSRESRSFGYEKHEKTKKIDFFSILDSLPQSEQNTETNFGPKFWGEFFSIFFLFADVLASFSKRVIDLK